MIHLNYKINKNRTVSAGRKSDLITHTAKEWAIIKEAFADLVEKRTHYDEGTFLHLGYSLGLIDLQRIEIADDRKKYEYIIKTKYKYPDGSGIELESSHSHTGICDCLSDEGYTSEWLMAHGLFTKKIKVQITKMCNESNSLFKEDPLDHKQSISLLYDGSTKRAANRLGKLIEKIGQLSQGGK